MKNKIFSLLCIITPIVALTGCSRQQTSLHDRLETTSFNSEFVGPATPQAEKIVKETLWILANIKDTDYISRPSIDEAVGKYHLTCGTFVSLVLQKSLPEHFERLTLLNNNRRPGSSTYYRILSTMPTEKADQNGWLQILSPAHARPGDIIAWRGIDPETGRRNTHVLIVNGMPEETIDGEFKINVVDSTYRGHRMNPTETRQVGIGTGYMWFHVDHGGKVDGYRWSGEFYKLFKPSSEPGKSSITIARAVALK